jgi:hypothetical protein
MQIHLALCSKHLSSHFELTVQMGLQITELEIRDFNALAYSSLGGPSGRSGCICWIRQVPVADRCQAKVCEGARI